RSTPVFRLEADRYLTSVTDRHELRLKKPVAERVPPVVGIGTNIVQVNKQVFLNRSVFDCYVAQPVDRVPCVERALGSDQLLLQVPALDLERKRGVYLPGSSIKSDVEGRVLVRCLARSDLHWAARAKPAGEHAAGEYRQQRNMHNVGAKPVVHVTLSEHGRSIVLSADATPEAEPFPGRDHSFRGRLRRPALTKLVIEHLRGDKLG